MTLSVNLLLLLLLAVLVLGVVLGVAGALLWATRLIRGRGGRA